MRPQRKRLPHDPPPGVSSADSIFFVTICAQPRGGAPLLAANRPVELLQAVVHRHQTGEWFARIFLIMPDHVHALVRFPSDRHPMRRTVSNFKRWTARTAGIPWQDGFFDHRLRHDEALAQKADYILQNPVRAGLVNAPEQWPHRWIATDAAG